MTSPHSATLIPLSDPSRPVQRKTRTTADSLLTSTWAAHDRKPGCCLSTPEWCYEVHAGSFLRSVVWIPDQPRALEDLVSSLRDLLLSRFFVDFRWEFFQDWPFGKTSMVIFWMSRVICQGAHFFVNGVRRRPHYAGGIWIWICAWRKLCQKITWLSWRHQMFSVHTKTQSRHFQIPPLENVWALALKRSTMMTLPCRIPRVVSDWLLIAR